MDVMAARQQGETCGRDSWRDSHLPAAPPSLSLSPPGDSVQSLGFVPPRVRGRGEPRRCLAPCRGLGFPQGLRRSQSHRCPPQLPVGLVAAGCPLRRRVPSFPIWGTFAAQPRASLHQLLPEAHEKGRRGRIRPRLLLTAIQMATCSLLPCGVEQAGPRGPRGWQGTAGRHGGVTEPSPSSIRRLF